MGFMPLRQAPVPWQRFVVGCLLAVIALIVVLQVMAD